MKYLESLKESMVLLIVFGGSFILSAPALSAPTVSGAGGTLTHGNSITISGSGFAAKANPTPLIWDNCSGTKITEKWSGGWPDAGTTTYQLTYRTPIRNVGLPHSHITKYMAGAHGATGPNAGYNVMVWKTNNILSYPQYIYFSAYTRLDPSWVFSTDNNLKTFDFSNGSSPYTMNSSSDSNWYAEYNPHWTSTNSGGSWHLNDDGGSLINPDANGKSSWWNASENPYTGWVKQEFELKITNQNDGFIKIWENGVLKVNYSGPTDRYNGTTKAIAIGGFARMYGQPNNFRYFADLYYDNSNSRVLACKGSTYANRGVCELQVPTNWNENSISVSFNQGALLNGSTAYFYVIDSNGSMNNQGYPFVIGGGITQPAPATPSGLRIIN